MGKALVKKQLWLLGLMTIVFMSFFALKSTVVYASMPNPVVDLISTELTHTFTVAQVFDVPSTDFDDYYSYTNGHILTKPTCGSYEASIYFKNSYSPSREYPVNIDPDPLKNTDQYCSADTLTFTFPAPGVYTFTIKHDPGEPGDSHPDFTKDVHITVGSDPASMAVTQDILAPSSNGSQFAQQPKITLYDANGDVRTSDNSTVVTVSKKDTGNWTLTGTFTAKATAGVVTFSGLGATNTAEVTGAQLAFNTGSLSEVTSQTVTLPAPAPHVTVASAANKQDPITGENDLITFTVKNSLGDTDTSFTGDKTVTVTGYEAAPDGTYGSIGATTLTGASTGVTVNFAAGVGTINLKLHKATAQTIGFSVNGVDTKDTSVSITPSSGTAASMSMTQDILAPTTNGGQFAQQPKITLMDAYENICTSDSSTVVTVSKKDIGNWTLIGTPTAKANTGVATFSGLVATNSAAVTGARLAFNTGSLSEVTSQTVTLPAPAPHVTVAAEVDSSSPTVGENDLITLTVKNALGATDTSFSGDKTVTVTGYQAAPNSTYGSIGATNLTGASTDVTVNFVAGVGTVNLKLHKAAAQTIDFSVVGVDTSAANSLAITPHHGLTYSMTVSQDITAPATNGGQFAHQPEITLKDAYGNICTSDNSTVVTVSKKDTGNWTLIGTPTATANTGIATFSGLRATNSAEVTGARLAFNTGSLSEVMSQTVTLPAPAPHVTVAAEVDSSSPTVGENDLITLTVKNSLGATDTSFTGDKTVTVTGYQAAPNSTYGSIGATNLTGASTDVTVNFVAGVGTVNLKLHKASAQTIGFSVLGVDTSAANSLSITPAHGAAVSMAVTQDILAPTTNGGQFAQQPKITLKDAYENICTSDSSTVVTVSKKDTGNWTLIGTPTATANTGIATFSGLRATNSAEVTGARLAFNTGSLSEVMSQTVTLPAPAPHVTVAAEVDSSSPTVGENDLITLTVKNSLGATDTSFTGDKTVTVTGYQAAPNSTYGSIGATNLTGASSDVTVIFVAGVGTVNLKLHKASAQTIGFSVLGVDTSAANSLSITPGHGLAASLTVTQDLTAPATNGGLFAQQPEITLKDAYENICTDDSTTVITVAKKDIGSWTLTGTLTAKATAGIATFSGLRATNSAEVTGARLSFNTGVLSEVTSQTVTLPAPAPHVTVAAAADTLSPIVGENDLITFIVKNTLGATDTSFTGDKTVTVTGYQAAPDSTFGSIGATNLTGTSTNVTVTFTAGVGTFNLKLHKAAAQTIGFSVAGVDTPASNNLSITSGHGTAAFMTVTQDITAPVANGGQFAQQPKLTLKDAYGNICTGNNSTVLTVAKKDAGSWTLTGTLTATANAGVATFSGLGGTNSAEITGARLAFNTGSLSEVMSTMVTLPAPAPHATATATVDTLNPTAGVNDLVTLTVKDALGATDTSFTGDKTVTVTGYQAAPDSTFGSIGATNLTGASTNVTVTFTAGVGTFNLKLHKAAAQTIGFSVAGVDTPVTNNLSITPVHGAAASMTVTRDITAPTSNGGLFTQQPKITLKDTYDNICTNDNSTVITVSKKDTGSWTLTGTLTATANAGVATFSGLAATNSAQVTGVRLAFNTGALSEVTSQAVTLPAPAPAPAPAPSTDDKKKKDSGIITKDQQQDKGVPETSLNTATDELKSAVFTKEELEKIEKGEDAKVILKVTDINNTVSEDDKKLIAEKVNTEATVMYVDLSLYKVVGNNTETRITETQSKINISIEVPEKLRNTDMTKSRIYQIVRVHDGIITIIDGTYDPATNLFSFETDQFSTYALTYEDTSAVTNKDSSDNENVVIVTKDFYHLCLTAKATATSHKLSFTKLESADGYMIYGASCGINNKMKKLADVSKDITSYNHKGLNKATYYKYQVKAYRIIDGKKVIIAVSKIIHSITTSSTYANPVKVTSDSKTVILAVGETKSVVCQIILPDGKRIKYHTAALRYESSDTAIVTVSNSGEIKAITKGTCYIYIYAQNGIYKKLKVTVK